jgi:hypothetical protein
MLVSETGISLGYPSRSWFRLRHSIIKKNQRPKQICFAEYTFRKVFSLASSLIINQQRN